MRRRKQKYMKIYHKFAHLDKIVLNGGNDAIHYSEALNCALQYELI